MLVRKGLPLLSLVLVAGCTSQVAGNAAPGTTLPLAQTTTPGVARPGDGVGPYRTGDCLVLESGIAKVPCAQPHEYETPAT